MPKQIIINGHPPTYPFGRYTGVQQRGQVKCRGDAIPPSGPDRRVSEEQREWMLANKPIYFVEDLMQIITHLPQHLRFA